MQTTLRTLFAAVAILLAGVVRGAAPYQAVQSLSSIWPAEFDDGRTFQKINYAASTNTVTVQMAVNKAYYNTLTAKAKSDREASIAGYVLGAMLQSQSDLWPFNLQVNIVSATTGENYPALSFYTSEGTISTYLTYLKGMLGNEDTLLQQLKDAGDRFVPVTDPSGIFTITRLKVTDSDIVYTMQLYDQGVLDTLLSLSDEQIADMLARGMAESLGMFKSVIVKNNMNIVLELANADGTVLRTVRAPMARYL